HSPSLTLFPYTTLFRSSPLQGSSFADLGCERRFALAFASGVVPSGVGAPGPLAAAVEPPSLALMFAAMFEWVDPGPDCQTWRSVDRKSTRLNSSHLVIS